MVYIVYFSVMLEIHGTVRSLFEFGADNVYFTIIDEIPKCGPHYRFFLSRYSVDSLAKTAVHPLGN